MYKRLFVCLLFGDWGEIFITNDSLRTHSVRARGNNNLATNVMLSKCNCNPATSLIV